MASNKNEGRNHFVTFCYTSLFNLLYFCTAFRNKHPSDERCIMVKQNIVPPKKSVRQTHLSRLYFLSKGCKQVPLDLTDGKVLWANPDEGYFMSTYGCKIKLDHSPAKRRRNVKDKKGIIRGFMHPYLRQYGSKLAHRLMFATFADEPCPIFFDSKGNPYKGIVHHVIENPYDIRMDNLMGWLSYKQHAIADKRRRALEAVVPDGDLRGFDYAILRELQDPRTMSDADFETRMEYLRIMHNVGFDPRIFNADDFHYWFSMPFDEFKNIMYKQKID